MSLFDAARRAIDKIRAQRALPTAGGGVRDALRRKKREEEGGKPVRGRRLRDLLGQNGRDLYD